VLDSQSDFPDPDPGLAAIADEKVWIQESFAKAKEVVYARPIGSDDKAFDLTKAYKDQVLLTAQERVPLAGARLANLLAETLR
jgi:S1/P1 Nuclease